MDQVLQVDSAPVLSQVPEAAVAHCRREKVQVKLVLFRKGGDLNFSFHFIKQCLTIINDYAKWYQKGEGPVGNVLNGGPIINFMSIWGPSV